MSHLETNHKLEYVKLLDLLVKAISVTKPSSISDGDERERLTYAHLLANRFSQYTSTVLYLLSGTKVFELPSFREHSFIDSASIDVLTRAAMEAFLGFHFVFYAPKTKEEKDYRYLTYKATGIAERQNYPDGIFEHKQQKSTDKEVLKKIRDKLESNITFRGLNNKWKTRLFQGEKLNLWRWNPDGKKFLSWYDIGIDAGFSKMLALYMYSHLSGSAHSSSLSVLQTAQALVNKETERLIGSSIDTMNILSANMIQEYCALFSEAQDVLQNSGETDFVQVWVNIGCRLGDNLDMG